MILNHFLFYLPQSNNSQILMATVTYTEIDFFERIINQSKLNWLIYFWGAEL